jgi:hypothetical protein
MVFIEKSGRTVLKAMTLDLIDDGLEKDLHSQNAKSFETFEAAKYWGSFAVHKIEICNVDSDLVARFCFDLKTDPLKKTGVFTEQFSLDPEDRKALRIVVGLIDLCRHFDDY